MTKDLKVHIIKLSEFRMKHAKLRQNFNGMRKPSKKLKDEMDGIRYTCSKYLEKNNILQYLRFGGSTPQQQSEFNDFDSISDFDEIMESVIIKLKSK